MSGRPLLDTKVDAALFVNRRREVDQVRAALDNGLNVLVVGERGSGKTSLVRRVMYLMSSRRREGEIDFVFVSGSAAANPRALLERVLVAAGIDTPVPPTAPVEQVVAKLGEWAAEQLSRGTPVVVLDGPPPAVANALFGTMRDELWALGVSWIVTVGSEGLRELMVPPADAFFEVTVQLDLLADPDATTLLERRVPEDLPAGVVAQALEIGGGNPRRLLGAARVLLDNDGPGDDVAAGYRARSQALARLGRSAHMVFVELEAMGQASASDPELLGRMGWTRPRAVQVLGELEKAGLVTAAQVKGTGGGRPRKVYAAVPATAFLASQHAMARAS